MSKIANDCLTRSGTKKIYSCTHMGVKWLRHSNPGFPHFHWKKSRTNASNDTRPGNKTVLFYNTPEPTQGRTAALTYRYSQTHTQTFQSQSGNCPILAASQSYILRPHHRELPDNSSHLCQCNFINRMLYKNSYGYYSVFLLKHLYMPDGC